MRRLLAVALVVVAFLSGSSAADVVRANGTTEAGDDATATGGAGVGAGAGAGPFLSDVIRRIDKDRRNVARPVQDLQIALERIAEIFGPEVAASDNEPSFEFPGNDEDLSTSVTPAAVSSATPAGVVAASFNTSGATLTPQELQALYQLATQKGIALDLSAVKGGYVPPTSASPTHGEAAAATNGGAGGAIAGPTPVPDSTGSSPAPDSADGYYYYFVPIKNLPLQQQPMQAQALMMAQQDGQNPMGMGMESAAASAALMAGGADRAVEPLFMAMAGFVGMALMFVASVLFLPKLGALRSLKHAPDEVVSISKLVLQSIEGKDCSERLTCEIGRAARTFKLGGKPLRILELVLPTPMSHQIGRIRQAAARKEKCNFIPCKYRRPLKEMFNKLPVKKPLKSPVKPAVVKASIFKPPSRPGPHKIDKLHLRQQSAYIVQPITKPPQSHDKAPTSTFTSSSPPQQQQRRNSTNGLQVQSREPRNAR